MRLIGNDSPKIKAEIEDFTDTELNEGEVIWFDEPDKIHPWLSRVGEVMFYTEDGRKAVTSIYRINKLYMGETMEQNRPAGVPLASEALYYAQKRYWIKEKNWFKRLSSKLFDRHYTLIISTGEVK